MKLTITNLDGKHIQTISGVENSCLVHLNEPDFIVHFEKDLIDEKIPGRNRFIGFIFGVVVGVLLALIIFSL